LKLLARRQGTSEPTAARRRARLYTWVRTALVALAVIALDRLTKQAVESSIQLGEERSFLPGVQLVHTHNSGVAFGLLGGASTYLTIAIAVAIVVALGYFAARVNGRPTHPRPTHPRPTHPSRPPMWLPTGMIVGGALGNVIDRLRFGHVTDFLKLPLGWPPFNLADAAITVGVLVLALIVSRSGAGETPHGSDEPRHG
jgi:signal peptidase II